MADFKTGNSSPARGKSFQQIEFVLRRHPKFAQVVAPATFFTIWGFALMLGLRLDFRRDTMLQFVGTDELASVSYPKLIESLHMQPVGFNLLLKMTDSFGSDGNAIWLMFLLAITLTSLWMIGDIVWNLTGQRTMAVVTGLVCSIAPATLFYSLWVFYTIPTAFLVTFMAWALVAGLVRGRVTCIALSMVAFIPLFFLRSTFAWPLALAWVLIVLLASRSMLVKRSPWIFALMCALGVATLVAVGTHQAATTSRFGISTQSSWSYENLSKALMTQMDEQEIVAATGQDACVGEVVAVGVFRPIWEYPTCATSGKPSSVTGNSALLDEEKWSSGEANMNSTGRLALMTRWQAFSMTALSNNPLTFLRIPFPNLETKERGTLFRFLWPSSWYWIIDANVAKAGMFGSIWIGLFGWVPLVSILGLIAGLIPRWKAWPQKDSRRRAYSVLGWSLVFLSVAYLYLETGENERFRMEFDWLLIGFGFVGWWSFASSRRGAGNPLPRIKGENGVT